MSDGDFQINDLVWAKMKGFSPWPGRVSEPPSELKRIPKKNIAMKCIFFFGSNNYAWIEDVNIKPYLEYKDSLIRTCKTVAAKDAVDAIESFIKDPSKFDSFFNQPKLDTDAEFNKLRDNSTIEESESVEPLSTSLPVPSLAKKVVKKKAEKPKPKATPKAKSDIESGPTPTKRKRLSSGELNHDSTFNSDYALTSGRRNMAATQLLNRPSQIIRPEQPEIDMNHISETLKSKNIRPSDLKFGFLGLGIMGSGIVKNLIKSGHKVILWNRTYTKCRVFVDAGAESRSTPADVIDAADITFSCVANPQAAKDMVFGNCGVLQAATLSDGKGYVEMTGIDPETSQDISEAIQSRGGKYLEAPLQGSKLQADEGTLIILASGDRNLFDECQTCFEAMGKNSFFLGEIGHATRMNLVLQMLSGISVAALAESMALADRAGLRPQDVLDILELTNTASPLLLEKGNAMIKGDYPTHQPVAHMQKDLTLALELSNGLEQSLPVTSATNEVYKHTKRLGYSEHDVSSVFVRARF